MANYIGYKFLINAVYFSPNIEILNTYYTYIAKHGSSFNRKLICKELAENLRLVHYHHYFRINKPKYEERRAMVSSFLISIMF